MKITRLMEALENSLELLGDVEVFIYDYNTNREYKVGGINNEADHIELIE